MGMAKRELQEHEDRIVAIEAIAIEVKAIIHDEDNDETLVRLRTGRRQVCLRNPTNAALDSMDKVVWIELPMSVWADNLCNRGDSDGP